MISNGINKNQQWIGSHVRDRDEKPLTLPDEGRAAPPVAGLQGLHRRPDARHDAARGDSRSEPVAEDKAEAVSGKARRDVVSH
jgi:hypothetical protein